MGGLTVPYIITFIICISGLVYIGIKEERRRRKLVSEKQRDYNISNEELMQSLMQPPLKLYDINKSNLEENKVKIVGFVKKISYIHTQSIYKTIRVRQEKRVYNKKILFKPCFKARF